MSITPQGPTVEQDDPHSTIARFAEKLGLPESTNEKLADAAKAVNQEYRDCSKWKKLRCRKVSVVVEGDRGIVFLIQLGHSVEFDWTWEGAIAFRPASVDGDHSQSDFDPKQQAFSDQIEWSGEIVEVDERNGCLFVSVSNPDMLPTAGTFFVRPFEFLAQLNSVYNDSKFETVQNKLPSRLAAAEGTVHPVIPSGDQEFPVGLDDLKRWWQHSWCVLWGPPGTGKTYTTGKQVAAILDDPNERVLVVSTTNRATDAVAVSIGNSVREAGGMSNQRLEELEIGRILRIGKGASLNQFQDHDLAGMMKGTESELLAEIESLTKQLRLDESSEDKAFTRKRIGEIRASSNDSSARAFVDANVRVVVATSFKAMSFLGRDLIHAMIENGDAPFTTIFIDEAGLISRAAVAVLSMLASRRVVLVGDSKQLAPISRISRILPTRQATWLASSGLSHLDEIESAAAAVHVLSDQHRMHPDVCKVVSDFQYHGFLKTAKQIKQRKSDLSPLIAEFSRAIWYVLDEAETDLASIRAKRGAGNKSWIRPATPFVLQQLFDDESIKQTQGLFLSPYRAQAQDVARLLTKWNAKSWESSTVHSQQGTESDLVIFDTVNAGSTNWPIPEWKRMVNVALSRAREAVIVIASRNEMEEPHLRALTKYLTPAVLISTRNGARWKKLDTDHRTGESNPVVYQHRHGHESAKEAEFELKPNDTISAKNVIGSQIADRKSLKPVLSHEQQRLCNLKLDGKPRLVRGVAGSGKSIVLSNWVAKTAQRVHRDKNLRDFRIWAVYANKALHKLLQDSIESAWDSLRSGQLFGDQEFPWDNVSLLHVKDVMAAILPNAGLSIHNFEFDYDRAAEEFLNRNGDQPLDPRCNALFIDEAQDMGPSALKLLFSLVEATDPNDPGSRSAHVFYDNAQNIYRREMPKWSELGLGVVGRSTIMRESFRSTLPITEFAINVLDRLSEAGDSSDNKELLRLGLLEKTTLGDENWLRVRFNQINGPKPIFNSYQSVEEEMNAIGSHLIHLIAAENISPTDICIIYNGHSAATQIMTHVSPRLAELDVELSVQTSQSFQRNPNTIVVTTAQSFKGYDAEVVFIPRADSFVSSNNHILAHNLYVAMTRARSLLAVYSQDASRDGDNESTVFGPRFQAVMTLNRSLQTCLNALNSTSDITQHSSQQDDFNDILVLIGTEHRKWLLQIWKAHKIIQEPIVDEANHVIGEPLFWFIEKGQKHACFDPDQPLSPKQERVLKQYDIDVIQIGAK